MTTAFQALTSSASNDWHTPPEIMDLVRKVLGSIELDPASCTEANATVQAERFFSIKDDGLSKPWIAKTIFLNPPYRRDAAKFCGKVLNEWRFGNFGSGVVLVRGDSAAMERLFEYCYHCRSKRIQFIPSAELLASKPQGWRNSPVPGTTFFYFGKNPERFCEAFSVQGKVFGPAYVPGSWRVS